VGFIKPPAVIGLLVVIEGMTKRVVNSRPKIVFKPPINPAVLDYLLAIDIIEALEGLSAWRIPGEHRTQATKRLRSLIPITRFRTSDDVEHLAHVMESNFRTQLVGLGLLLQPCHIII